MNIHILDLNFQNVPHAIASYLLVGSNGPVLVETGPTTVLPALQAGLAKHGYTPEDVKHVLVTHIHLDHAGSAGWWAQQGSRVYVHHVGAPHLIDPSKLVASATRIYGDQMDTLWGEIIPAPAENVTAVYDGDTIDAGGLSFTALDTPGHAGHHHVYRLGDIAFIGDAGAIKLPGKNFIDLPAPPPEFNLDTWLQTIERLVDEEFAAIYPTHFGPIEGANVRPHWQGTKTLLKEAAEFVRRHMEAGVERDELVEKYTAWNRERARNAGLSQGVIRQYEVVNPLYMSVDGIMRYWRKRQG